MRLKSFFLTVALSLIPVFFISIMAMGINLGFAEILAQKAEASQKAQNFPEGSSKNPVINRNPLKTGYPQTQFLKNNKVLLTLDLDLAQKHKAYANEFKIKFQNSKLSLTELQIEPLTTGKDKYNKNKETLFFEGHGKVRATFKVTGPLQEMEKVFLTYKACTKEYCLLPKTISFSAPFQLSDQKDKDQNSDTNKSKGLFSFDFSKPSFLSFIAIFIFGLLTSFTPCVFPMIPITLGVLGHSSSSNRTEGFLIGLIYSLGLSLTYALVGVFAALSGSFVGQLLTNPYIVWGIFAFYILFALSILGVFTLQTPPSLNKLLNKVQIKGFVGIFFVGMVGGIIASPCVGPVVATILTYVAQSKDPYYGFAALFIYGLGFGSLFILMGAFYGELSNWLRPGKWMNWTKYILAALILLGAALFIRPHLSSFYGPQETQKEHSGNWKTFSKKLLEESKKEGKAVIIDFYADWCSSCEELDHKVFSLKDFEDFTSELVLLKFDATRSSDKENKILSEFEVVGLPTVLFISPSGEIQEDLTLTGFEEWNDLKLRIKSLKTRK